MNTTASTSASDKVDKENNSVEGPKAHSAPASNLGSGSSLIQGQETEIKREDSIVVNPSVGNDEGKKSSGHLNNHPGKKKVKVDWTPELHRRFVQAVEQLGVDKAVPSKILELMGVDYLTRHNVASHLQKYRSHRKHLLAREAEVATWNRRRQIYGTTRRTANRDVNSWVVPSMAFHPVAPVNHSTPLHVWGHPSAPPPPVWTPSHPMHPLPGDTSSWYCCRQDVPVPGMPYFPHFPSTGFATPPIYTYRVKPDIGVPFVPCGQTPPQPPSDAHLSKESIDAVIGDALSKPWLPLPLGLKPPSIDSVMVELQRQGISKIPPQSAIK